VNCRASSLVIDGGIPERVRPTGADLRSVLKVTTRAADMLPMLPTDRRTIVAQTGDVGCPGMGDGALLRAEPGRCVGGLLSGGSEAAIKSASQDPMGAA
jgi:hypothetical protein